MIADEKSKGTFFEEKWKKTNKKKNKYGNRK